VVEGKESPTGIAAKAPGYTYDGIHLASLGPQEAADCLFELAVRRRPVGIHLCNAYTLSLARRNEAYKACLSSPALNLVDGTPVTWFGLALKGAKVPPAVRGPSLMRALIARHGLQHYLLGGSPGALSRLQGAIVQEHPEAIVAGSWSPPFRALTEDDYRFVVDDVAASGANIVWVGLGTPKQDLLISGLVAEVGVPMVAVGAAFDFLSGSKSEAPRWLRGTGLEWIFRLLSEPRRLWRRYLFGNFIFVSGALKEIIHGGRHRIGGPGRRFRRHA